ncbi:phage portal protein [Bradyrhizobium liaoningense]|uniref:phage portal protein n=1 Tax=Bradyrhizobium liaoningense TaxID=43992 RepID=UPI001BA99003|nr:phage portal protein [Bradyrhizobium liaoningense]MBR0906962.1 phage portal protein [Bradyrhizobium liaoningense]
MLEFITKFFKKSYSLADQFPIFPNTTSGLSVDPHSAMRVPAVNAAVRVIAESVASLPVNILKLDGDSKTAARDHPVFRLIHYQPNEWQSSFDLRLQLQLDALLTGNGYAFVNRIGGVPRELIRVPPGTVTVEYDTDTGEPFYTVRDATNRTRTIRHRDMIHIRAVSVDGISGTAPIQHAREAIGLALAMEQHASSLMGKGARPGGILKIKNRLDDKTMERFKQNWQNFVGGSANSGRTAVLDFDADFTPMTFSSVDLQFIELRKFQIEEISRAFRVPPHLLSELGRATWGNSVEMNRSFLDSTLMPWLLQWQGVLNRTLFTPEERLAYSVEFDTSALTRANLQARTEAYSAAVGGPWMTPNEARALENRAPIEGGDKLIAANDNHLQERNRAA